MPKMKPCPFCGGAATLRETFEHYEADAEFPAGSYSCWYTIGCDACGVERADEYQDEAVANWNKRVRRRA